PRRGGGLAAPGADAGDVPVVRRPGADARLPALLLAALPVPVRGRADRGGGVMDVVYPLPPKRAAYEELRYSLRSLANLPHDRVFIAGGLPNWVDNVEHIETVQEWPSKYVNLCVNIASACCDDRVSDPFILFNDDFFVMEPVEQVPARWRETLRDGIERSQQTPHMRRA